MNEFVCFKSEYIIRFKFNFLNNRETRDLKEL